MASRKHPKTDKDGNYHTWAACRADAVEALKDVIQCAYCKRIGTDISDPDGKYWTFDHVIPQSNGGKHRLDNIVKACWLCNTSKGARTDGWLSEGVAEKASDTYPLIQQKNEAIEQIIKDKDSVIESLTHKTQSIEYENSKLKSEILEIKILAQVQDIKIDSLDNENTILRENIKDLRTTIKALWANRYDRD